MNNKPIFITLPVYFLSFLQFFSSSHGWIPTIGCAERQKETQLCGRQYFRGRSVPYVETLAEQKSRELWEQEPFDHAERLIDRVLASDFPSNSPFLKKISDHSTTESSGFEDLFLPLYGTKDDGIWEKPIIDFGERKEKLKHFLIRVSYKGNQFCGWQIQRDNELPSVQGVLEDWLQPLAERKKSIRVCGRTDAGVSAIAQVCRFRTALDLDAGDIAEHLQKLPSAGARVQQVVEVTRSFHPTFTATCRAYVYLIDCTPLEGFNSEMLGILNQILQALEGKELDYIGLSYGRLKTETSLCTLHHARACLVSTDDESSAVCIELVGNRFLRRMVRLLVEAAVRITLAGDDPSDDVLLDEILKEDRRLIGNTAPANGLFFVGARFDAM
ncbi:unnamed protein product [Cylindrotheca closterium]|uniref:tRNA pseudouridine synthase n=1 Tax=Cylindrotheca closterium TaxID=2856 RepID=A0AAD2GEB1_9STRA|nr:unnamed protein product [Cylindrotheca closterium]